MLSTICPKCDKLSYAPIVQTIRNKSGSFTYRIFRHPRTRQKTGKKYVQRCYVRI